jgi:hypothetical protein
MAYGQNAPFGLQPVCSINGGSWTEKVNEYEIYASADGATTYNASIFTGDPVRWGTSVGGTAAAGKIGTIIRWDPVFADGAPSTWNANVALPILGVFMGCRYYSSNISTNNLVQSAYWPAATQVQPGTTITALILDDPNVVYNIQVSSSINAAANAFVGRPYFPNTNATGGAPYALAGSFGRNFALNIGGGTNFDTVNLNAVNAGYANNPTAGSRLTGQSAFYLDVDTSTVAANDHDYNKNAATLPLRALGYTDNPKNVAAPGLTMGTTPFLNVLVTLNQPVYAIGSAPTVYVA